MPPTIEEIEESLTEHDVYWAVARMKEGHTIRQQKFSKREDPIYRIRYGYVEYLFSAVDANWTEDIPSDPDEWASLYDPDIRYEINND